jgi:hypothetical protein
MALSRDQHAGENQNKNTGNNSFENVEHSRYLGNALRDQNSILEEIKSRLISGNVCYHSVQNLWPKKKKKS